MGKLGGFKYKEVIRRLKLLGLEFKRQAKGSHEIWHNPNADCLVVIPNHKDIKEFTLKSILKQANINEDEFLSI
jgi:predicted RNA binding protein YcfA (HicA-like mRNA interferase family)